MTKKLSRQATKVKSKYRTAEEKRLARNARVRIRRVKQRAEKRRLKKIAKRSKQVAREILTPPRVQPRVVVVVGNKGASVYVNGTETHAFDYGHASAIDFVSGLNEIFLAVGIATTVTDLRN